jgi:hypothetical protein
MKSLIVLGLFGLALSAVACGGSDPSAPSPTGISSADRLVLDVRCASNADCPATFECELESEHGAPTSFCKSHDTIGSASSPSCPAGTEAELEHGTTFCKAHGGASSGGGGAASGGGGAASGGASSGGGTASGGGGTASGGADDDAGASSGGAAAGATCATNADCASGLQCEVQVELGVTTSTCKAHGGKK